MSRSLWLVASLSLALAAPLATAAGQTTQTQAGERRTVVVGVLTTRGQLVNGLDPGQFRVELGGQPIRILSATYDTTPHRVVLLLDVSGSMDEKRSAEVLVAEKLLRTLNPADPIAALTFTGDVNDRWDFSTDHGAMAVKIANLKAPTESEKSKSTRRTAIYGALKQALGLLNPTQDGDTICVISDGEENAASVSEPVLRRALSDFRVRVFGLLIYKTTLWRKSMLEEVARDMGAGILQELGDASGGAVAGFDSGDAGLQLGRWVAKHESQIAERRELLLFPAAIIAREIDAFYRLEIELPERIEKPCGWKLEVMDPATGKPDHNLILHYPTRLYPAQKSSDK